MNQQDKQESDIISGRDINRLAENAFRKGANAMAKIDPDKQVKLFGLFEVDAGLAEYLKSAYNVFADLGSQMLMPKAHQIATKLGSKAGLQGSSLYRSAAVATVAVDVAMKTGGYVGPFFQAWKEQTQEKRDLARKLAPVLDEKIGKHSVGALQAASHDNEMIRVQLLRMAKVNKLSTTNNLVDLAVNAGPNIALSLMLNARRGQHLWHGGDYREFQQLEAARTRAKTSTGEDVELGSAAQGKQMVQALFNSLSGPVSSRIQKSNERKLQQSTASPTGVQMVLTLQEQVEHNPKARSFQMPGRRGETFALEEYIMRIIIQHQHDMADISPDHTEIREALKDDLAASVKPIAAAIRSGDINALELIRLVGEGQVIKSNGRAIASAEEVEDYLARGAEKPVSQVHADPKEWYKSASFTPAQMKQALGSLEGEERANFAALFPDSLLEQAGMHAKDIKAMREAMVRRYEPMLAEAVFGLAQHSDEMLKKEGLASHEIKQLRAAVANIEREGVEAVHALRASPTNDHGTERLLTNWAVNNIEYYGRVVSEGKELLAEATKKPRISHTDKYRSRSENDHYPDAENDNEMSHAERARAGRFQAGHERE